ncbi:MAG: FtsX-like permease family protein, partial [Kangiellaceae bacterium]|nr:FtsX-like permease family protein [Kangiellaceae bacterium]
FNKAFLEQLGDISLIISGVVIAGFFTILLVVGTSMAQNISERTGEIAVLKTLGFTSKRIFGLVLTESLLLSSIGGLLGLFIANGMVAGASQDPKLKNMLPNLIMGQDVVIQSLIFILLLGLITGIIPAWRAMKLNIIDALNRN